LANDKKSDLRPRCDVHVHQTMEYNQTILRGDRSQRLTVWFGCPEEACERGFSYMMGYFDTSKTPTVAGGPLCKVHFEHLVVQQRSRGVFAYVCPVVGCREALEWWPPAGAIKG
jgi:hypothetical protein